MSASPGENSTIVEQLIRHAISLLVKFSNKNSLLACNRFHVSYEAAVRNPKNFPELLHFSIGA